MVKDTPDYQRIPSASFSSLSRLNKTSCSLVMWGDFQWIVDQKCNTMFHHPVMQKLNIYLLLKL